MKLIVILLLVSKCFMVSLHDPPIRHENTPIILVHDPLWIIEPDNGQNLVPHYSKDFIIKDFVKTNSDHHPGHYPISQLSGFVQARPLR